MKCRLASVLVLAVIISLLLPADVDAFVDLPSGFTDELVVDGVPAPTAIAWLPDGDLLITAQAGILFRWDGSGAAESMLDLSSTICSGGETGLLGVAVDPNFDSGQRFIYLYYTTGQCDTQDQINRVSRFDVPTSGPIETLEVLIDNIPAPGGNHNAGDLQFGKDGLLYVSVGDGGEDLVTGQGQDNNGNARRLDLLNGKILRIDPNGDVPAVNLFQGDGTESCAANGMASQTNHKCQEIIATGLRNPFRIALDPDDGNGQQRLYINDVGGGAWEEIDELDNGDDGADYGWNVREGPCNVGSKTDCPPANQFQEPIFAYQHNGDCDTITGGAFVPDNVNWPDQFDDVYLYADFGCDTLFVLNQDGSQRVNTEKKNKHHRHHKSKKRKRKKRRNENPPETVFGTGTTAVHLAFGPDDALYYTAFFDDAVRKIEYTVPGP